MPANQKPSEVEENLDIASLKGVRRSAFPPTFIPMLASPAENRFSSSGWIYEPKMDGIRGIVLICEGKVRILSRRGLDLTSQYPGLATEIGLASTGDTILDGEIIALNELGRPSFQHLQQRMNLTRDADVLKAEQLVPVFFFVFDIVQVGEFSLTAVPLAQRKEVLRHVVKQTDHIRVLNYFTDDGRIAYEACVENGFEGVVAKRVESPYEPGRRSPYWIKVKAQQTAEFVIGGYTPGQGSRGSTFGALLLGFYDDNNNFIYCGSVGTGFDDRLLFETMRRLTPNVVQRCPYLKKPADKRDAIWIQPTTVIEVKFMDWTRDGHLRTPVFLRFRDDKTAAEIGKEQTVRPFEDAHLFHAGKDPSPSEQTVKKKKADVIVGKMVQTLQAPSMVAESTATYVTGKKLDSVLIQLSGKEKTLELLVGDDKIPLTHLDKSLWPKDSQGRVITKRDYLRAVATVAPFFLRYLQNRAVTLIRSPDGVKGKAFFQKHWNFTLPEFVETVRVTDAEEEKGYEEYLLCNNLSTLLFLAQHGALEFHTFSSRLELEPDIKDLNSIAAGLNSIMNDSTGVGAGLTPPNSSTDGTISSAWQALLEYPDFLIFDLDQHVPSTKKEVKLPKSKWTATVGAPNPIDVDAFKRAADVALLLKEELESLTLVPFVKTSGRNGLHVYVPIIRNIDHDVVRALSETLVQYMLKKHGDLITVETNIQKRAGKVYLDHAPNGRGKNTVVAYSPRASLEATFSMPLEWSEVESASPLDFNQHDIAYRLQNKGDIWANILFAKKDLERLLTRKK